MSEQSNEQLKSVLSGIGQYDQKLSLEDNVKKTVVDFAVRQNVDLGNPPELNANTLAKIGQKLDEMAKPVFGTDPVDALNHVAANPHSIYKPHVAGAIGDENLKYAKGYAQLLTDRKTTIDSIGSLLAEQGGKLDLKETKPSPEASAPAKKQDSGMEKFAGMMMGMFAGTVRGTTSLLEGFGVDAGPIHGFIIGILNWIGDKIGIPLGKMYADSNRAAIEKENAKNAPATEAPKTTTPSAAPTAQPAVANAPASSPSQAFASAATPGSVVINGNVNINLGGADPSNLSNLAYDFLRAAPQSTNLPPRLGPDFIVGASPVMMALKAGMSGAFNSIGSKLVADAPVVETTSPEKDVTREPTPQVAGPSV